MPEATDLLPSDPRLIADYRIVRRLGSGGQGIVYLATARSGERVAIKQLRADSQDDRAQQQFAKEVAAARRVEPFCTARVLDADLTAAAPYVVSEYIEGPTLHQHIQRQGPMSGDELQALAVGTITALASIHQAGVVHRDFKPANVMLANDGPRVIDFGVARDMSQETTVTSRIFGTPAYMAPEQLRAERVGPPADLFGWAGVVSFAASGRAPFDAEHMMAVVYRITSSEPDLRGVPYELVPVLERCLDKDPQQRPTAQQVLALLLGRPEPVGDLTDPAGVLAEATGKVQAEWVPPPTPPTSPTSPDGQYPPSMSWPPALPTPTPTPSLPPSPHWPSYVASPNGRLTPAPGPRRGGSGASGRSGDDSRGSGGGSHRWRLPALAVACLAVGCLGLAGFSALGGWGFWQTSAEVPYDSYTTSPSTVTSAKPRPKPRASTSQTKTSAVAAPVPARTVPPRFAGTWRGTLFQAGGPESWSAVIRLKSGASRGTMQIPELGCTGPIVVAVYLPRTSTLTLKPAVTDPSLQDVCISTRNLKLSFFTTSSGLTLRWPVDSKLSAYGVFKKS